MGKGLNNRVKTCFNVRLSIIIKKILGFEAVVRYLRNLDKVSTKAILQKFGAKIGPNCDIESGLVIHNAAQSFSNLIVEDYCHIGKDVFIDLKSAVFIHSGSTISMRVNIISHLDMGNANIPNCTYKKRSARVNIGSNVYVGAGAIILAGVTVSGPSVIGAGAVVNRDIPSGSLAVGVPAKISKLKDVK